MFTADALLPLPDLSRNVLPLVSAVSKLQNAAALDGIATGGGALPPLPLPLAPLPPLLLPPPEGAGPPLFVFTSTIALPTFPAASRAKTATEWLPFDQMLVFQSNL